MGIFVQMTITAFTKRSIGKLVSGDPYVKKAQSICLDWLDGRESFTLSTSGSTGPPKQISVSATQLKASVYATSEALSLPQGTKALICLNIDYVAGFMMLIRAMELDWEAVLVNPAGNPLLGLPSDLFFDFTAMVPMQLAEVLSNRETAIRAQKLGKILLGGVALTASQTELFRNTGQEIYVGYGMTETVSHVALQKLGHPGGEENTYSVTGDVEYGVDSRGCLFFRGAVTRHELVQTNDLADLLPGRRAFRLLGRIDNTVNSGGIKIQIEEMEKRIEAVFRNGGIPNRFFLWKIPDSRLGEKLVLVVEGSPDLENRISEVLKNGIEQYKRPRKIYFTGLFLKTGSDKVDKYRTFEDARG